MTNTSPVDRVRALLAPAFPIVEFDASTATSGAAAEAIGCSIAEIAKSLIFRTKSDRPILVVASGVNRVDERKVGVLVGEKVGRADAAFVLAKTGFPVGGVAPVGHLEALEVVLDADLQAFAAIWAAAGAPNAVFTLSPADLQRLTGGRFADIAEVGG